MGGGGTQELQALLMRRQRVNKYLIQIENQCSYSTMCRTSDSITACIITSDSSSDISNDALGTKICLGRSVKLYIEGQYKQQQ